MAHWHPATGGSILTERSLAESDLSSHAYVAAYSTGLHVVDISDPSSPATLGGMDTPDRALGVAVAGGLVFVADSGSGLRIFPAQCETSTGMVEVAPAAASLFAAAVRLHPSSPNPFTALAVIRYELPRTAQVDLRIFDAAGRLVRVLEDMAGRDAGEHLVSWNGRDHRERRLPAGVYRTRIAAGPHHETCRMVLLK